MPRNGNPEESSSDTADMEGPGATGPSVVLMTQRPPSGTGGPTPAMARSSGLSLRIGMGFAAMTLVFVLLIGLIAARILDDATVSSELATSMRNALLGSGICAVALAGLLGVLFARQISEPLRQLTEEITRKDFRELAGAVDVRDEFREIERLFYSSLSNVDHCLNFLCIRFDVFILIGQSRSH